jgi:hypothetical protein
LVNDIPAGDGRNNNLFYSVVLQIFKFFYLREVALVEPALAEPEEVLLRGGLDRKQIVQGLAARGRLVVRKIAVVQSRPGGQAEVLSPLSGHGKQPVLYTIYGFKNLHFDGTNFARLPILKV